MPPLPVATSANGGDSLWCPRLPATTSCDALPAPARFRRDRVVQSLLTVLLFVLAVVLAIAAIADNNVGASVGLWLIVAGFAWHRWRPR